MADHPELEREDIAACLRTNGMLLITKDGDFRDSHFYFLIKEKLPLPSFRVDEYQQAGNQIHQNPYLRPWDSICLSTYSVHSRSS